MISKKVTQFNESLLKNGKTESDGDSSDSENEEGIASVVNSEANSGSAEQYYSSSLWKQKVDSTLSAIGEIEQPQHPKAQASHAHPQSQSSTVQVNALGQQLSICPTKSN